MSLTFVCVTAALLGISIGVTATSLYYNNRIEYLKALLVEEALDNDETV